jgi:cytochrome c biogenesis protein CcmG/thiol:disulfide interchange protein DsbE
MRSVKLAVLIAVVLLVFAILYYGLTHSGSEQNTSMMNEPVPEFQLQSLQGDSTLDETIFQGGETKLLNIWASWCAACKVEHPFLIELANRNIVIVGLNYRDNRTDAKKVILADGNPYRHIIYDKQGELALDLGVLGAPETFVIDANGKILARASGVIDADVWQSELAQYFDN